MSAYRITQVASDADLFTWRLLRQRVYLEEGLLTPDDVGSTMYIDTYDAYSEHFLVWDSLGAPVGTGRLIFGAHVAGQRLQIEDTFDVDILPDSAEVSGFAILREHRVGLAQVGLLRAMIERLRERGVSNAYAEVEPWFFRGLNRFGYPCARISESKFVFNAENFVIHMPLDDFWEGVEHDISRARRTLRGTYYSHPWDGTIGDQHLVFRDA